MLTTPKIYVTLITTVGSSVRCPQARCGAKLAESVEGTAWFTCRSCKSTVKVEARKPVA